MSKVGQWVFEMQEDAVHMSLAQFMDKHGSHQAEIWYEANFGDDRDMEPNLDEYEAMAEGYHG